MIIFQFCEKNKPFLLCFVFTFSMPIDIIKHLMLIIEIYVEISCFECPSFIPKWQNDAYIRNLCSEKKLQFMELEVCL